MIRRSFRLKVRAGPGSGRPRGAGKPHTTSASPPAMQQAFLVHLPKPVFSHERSSHRNTFSTSIRQVSLEQALWMERPGGALLTGLGATRGWCLRLGVQFPCRPGCGPEQDLALGPSLDRPGPNRSLGEPNTAPHKSAGT